MPTTLTWYDVLLRLAIAVGAGAVVGFNRGEHGHSAGLRTTILVCVAASAAMIQVNLLLVMAREKQSLVTLDLMRLPLGILSGMGFIGGGAILRRRNVVLGVTTAATLWYVTVMGLCIGGGQIVLGLELLALAVFILWSLKRLEGWIVRDRRATLTLTLAADGPTEDDLRRDLQSQGFSLSTCALSASSSLRRRTLRCEVRWRTREKSQERTPAVVEQLGRLPGVRSVRWIPSH